MTENRLHSKAEALPVVCCLASFPPRKKSMLKVVERISRQCDLMCIWLNQYDEVPAELGAFDNLDIRLGNGVDVKDTGKFAFLDKYRNCYYLTVDDDINYPDDYVQRLCSSIDRYGRACVCSYCGILRAAAGKDILLKYDKKLARDCAVNVLLGTGTCGFVPNRISMPSLSAEELKDIDTDLSMAVFAMNNGIPMICLAHKKRWLSPIVIDGVEYRKVDRLYGSGYLTRKRENIRKRFANKTRTIYDAYFEADVLQRHLNISSGMPV